MALIRCPGCGQRVSDVLSMCPNCGHVRGEVDDERLLEFQRRKLRDHVYHLNMTSYVVITVFLGGFGWYWWDTSGFQERASFGPIALLGVSTVAYLAIRGFLFNARRKLKKLTTGI
ncbi:MAG: hypothetical protein HKN58_08475 [Xanthomonadales bacterium]|nr:hypothetical protein [Xanthomonadales bacterium]